LAPIDDPWDVDAWYDAWIVQLSVRVQEPSLGVDQHIFLGTDDIVSNLDWMIPFAADLRYKRFGFMPDILGLKLSGSNQTPGPLFDDVAVGLKMWVVNLAGYYRLVDQPDFSLDLIGGARYLYVNTDLAFTGGPVGNSRGNLRANSTSTIWNGIVGARVRQDLSDRFFYSIYGDVGAGDSDLTWQLLGSLGYRVSENFSALLGYRYLHFDEEEGGASIGVTGSGPQITLKWDF
jgi:opacity protein-like surface antigen